MQTLFSLNFKVTYVTKGLPPFLLIHGNADALVPYRQSLILRDRMEAAGAKVELYTVEGGGHGMNGWDRDPKMQAHMDILIEWISAAFTCGKGGQAYGLRVKILFIGDIVGEPGRRAIKSCVPALRQVHALDMVVANGENSAGGSGLTMNTVTEILGGGVDVITTGDHLWDQKEVVQVLQQQPRVIRPLNYPAGTVGSGSALFQPDGKPAVAVLNLQGRVFMPNLENPFATALEEVKRLRTLTKIILVDFHAEATSEKIALARMLDGQVSAVVGTHTHVQTADEQIFPGGTAFLCDAGFTGPHESVLGREIEPVIKRFLTYQPQRFPVAAGRILLQGVVIEIDETTGQASRIQRLSEALPASPCHA